MASASDPGLNFKISGQVDPNFIASVASAKDNVAKSNVESKGWQATLKSLGGTLGGAAKFVGALALEQKLHHDRTKDSVAATKEQSKAIEKLTSTMAPLAVQLKALVELQTNQIKLAPQQTQAIQQQAQAMTSATSAAHTFGGAVQEGEGHLDAFRNAAQSAFSGNLTGAVETLGASVAGFVLPVAAAVAAVSLINEGLKTWENSEKLAGKAMEDESKQIVKVTKAWHEYATAIGKAKGLKDNFLLTGKTAQQIEAAVKSSSTTANIGAMFPKDVAKDENKDRADQMRAKGQDIDAQKVKDQLFLAGLKERLFDAETRNSKIKVANISDPDQAKALGAEDALHASYYGEDQSMGVPVPLDKLREVIALKEKALNMDRQSLAANKALTAEADRYAKAIVFTKVAKERIDEVTDAYSALGGRANLTKSRDYTAGQVKSLSKTFTGLTKIKDTSDENLQSLRVNDSTSDLDRERIKALLDAKAKLKAANKAISDFDKEADKERIEAGRKTIAQLEEQLQLRKALGQSNFADVARTRRAQLAAAADGDTQSKTHLQGKTAEEHGQFLEGDLKEQLSGVQQAYKELASTGTATSAQLATANRNVASAALAWKNENAGLLGQYPKLKEQIDSITSAAKVESGHIQQKTFAEQFQTLKSHIEDGANAAQGLQDRLKATKVAIDETNAAYAKGLITQKQATEELSGLAKERANQERAIAEAMAQQQKAVDALKGKLAGHELKRLESDKSSGRDPAFYDQRREKLQADEVRAQLKVIDDEYQAAVKGNKDQVLAAQEASLKKKLLFEEEADKFVSEEDRKTNALKAANKNRLGGEASPLVGLNEGASFSGVGFSGFGNFGDNFGKFSHTRSAFDSYQDAQLPGAVGDVFKSKQSYEGGKPQSGSTTTTNHYNVTAEHMPQGIVKDFCKAASEAAKYMSAVSGDGAPAMTKRTSADVWDKGSTADSWQK